jgi:transposase
MKQRARGAKRRPAIKKISTLAIEGLEIFKPNQLTIGLDLGDRTSCYCILNEAGEIILEQELPTTPKGFEPVFGRIPRSRIALETGTHSRVPPQLEMENGVLPLR